MASHLSTGVSWAGLLAGPGAWAINTQLGYALVDWSCVTRLRPLPFVAAALLLVALAGAFLSWRAWRHLPEHGSVEESTSRQPLRMVAAIGVLLSVLFALVIAAQGMAGVMFDGCER